MGPPAVLLTLGRLPVALELARSFSAAGWRVVVAEPLALHLCRMSRAVHRCHRVTAPCVDPDRYVEELRHIAREESVSLVVPASEECVHASALADDVHGPPVFGPPRARTLALHDKLRFCEMARALGLRVPPSAGAGEPAADRIAATSDYVVKPRHGCSGRGVRFFPRGHAVPRAPGCVVQERLHGDLLSTFCLARAGDVVASVTYRAAVRSGSVAVAFERVDGAARVERWVRTFAGRSQHTGFLAFDFVVEPGREPAAIECNPRPTSGIHFLESAGLAPAILGEAPACALREATLLAESYSCFTAALGAVRRPARSLEALARLWRARDVTWSARDPWPFLLMTFNTSPILARAITRRQTFAEVAVTDVEWREPSRAPDA